MAFNPMNTLTRIENIFCIYRNYCALNKTQRFILVLRLLLEIAVVAVPLIKFHLEIAFYMSKTDIIFFSLSVLCSATIMFLALYHTKDFQNLKMRFEKNHVYFAKDLVYSRNINKKCKFIAIVLSAYVIFVGSVAMYVDISTSSNNNIITYFYRVVMMIYYLRYLFEFVVLYGVLLLVSEQVKCMTRKISNDRKLKVNDSDESSEDNDEILQEITGFEEWTKLYTNIKECSNLINTVFGVQITITLTSLIFFFIMFLYAIASMSISGNIVFEIILVHTIKVIVMLIALYALSRGAQTAENSANDLRRCLGKLLIYSSIDDGSYKSIKDFLRLVTNRPIKTQAFGSINVDMTLVPKFVMFFTSYTVIALQFNNVV